MQLVRGVVRVEGEKNYKMNPDDKIAELRNKKSVEMKCLLVLYSERKILQNFGLAAEVHSKMKNQLLAQKYL